MVVVSPLSIINQIDLRTSFLVGSAQRLTRLHRWRPTPGPGSGVCSSRISKVTLGESTGDSQLRPLRVDFPRDMGEATGEDLEAVGARSD